MNRCLLTLLGISLAIGSIGSFGCSLPLKVVRVESGDPVKGVRYRLKRPSYRVGLRADMSKTEFLVNPPLRKLERGSLAVIDAPARADWFTGDSAHLEDGYCIRMQRPGADHGSDASRLILTLRQEMKGKPLLYEARSRWTPPHWFANSESSITLDDEGALTAITAGESDKTLEFVQAVAGLVVSAAKVAVDVAPPESCLQIGDPDFHEYVGEHIRLTARKSGLKRDLDQALDGLDPSHPEQMRHRLDSVELLRAEIEFVAAALKNAQYDLPAGAYDVRMGGRSLLDKAPDEPWIVAELTPE